MALKAITINTDTAQDPHIYAIDDAEIFNSIIGGEGVHNWEENFAAEIIDNNTVRIKSGVLNIQGHFARTGKGEYTDITIENGSQTLNRNDLIVAEFRTDSGIDNIGFKVIKGEPSESAKDPVYVQEDLLSNGLVRQLPLYRVVIDKLALTSLQPMFSPLPTLTKIQSHIGMIVQSTTLDTMEKVISIYGGIAWNKIEGRFLIGASDSYPSGSTGGSNSHFHSTNGHSLTQNEIPSHRHAISGDIVAFTSKNNGNVTMNKGTNFGSLYSMGADSNTSYAGGGAAHNHGNTGSSSHIPSYKAVYIWERTE